MSASSVSNLRIYLYGVQGSGSLFPGRKERMAYQEHYGCELLERIYRQMQSYVSTAGTIDCSPEEFFGGPMNRDTFLGYLHKVNVPEPRVYGGWTTCIRIETVDGDDIVLDCGSGFRNCAAELQDKWGERAERDLYVFGSHSHVDHTEGFDQAAVCFDQRNHIHVYGNRQFLLALDYNLGIFSRHVDSSVIGLHTPINYRVMPTRFTAYQIHGDGDSLEDPQHLADEFHHVHEPIILGETTIQPFQLHHPAPCLGYRIQRAGRVFVFCTDHELMHGNSADEHVQASRAAETRLRAHAEDADLLYRDGQYFRPEYDGIKGIGGAGAIPRAGWGHSCIEDVQEMAQDCRVRRTLIGHHDPNRSWVERNWIDEQLVRSSANSACQLELAKADMWIDL